LNTDDFIQKANKIHSNKYNYSLSLYVNHITKLTIKCQEHGEFNQTPRAHLVGQGCPSCYNKTEGKLKQFLEKWFKIVECQKKVGWCLSKHTGKALIYDFYLPEINTIIELDGPQHFKQVSNWTPYSKIHEIDMYKMNCALENGLNIVRIYQPDVACRNEIWLKHNLYHKLINVNNNIIYIASKQSIYENFI
jgi:hypothetical protein